MKQFGKYLLGVLVVLSGCGEDESPQQDDRQYFPLQTGFYQIYTVEEIVYTEFNPPDSFVYELKTEVVDSFANQEGGFTFVIYRSVRATENDPWEFQEAWSARISPYQAILTEGNISFVRIAFPANTNKEWNGNALNSFPEDLYEISGAGDSFDLTGEQEFDDCLVIVQEQSMNLFSKDERQEVYARNVGLIYKVTSDIKYCNDGMTPAEGGCVGLYIIESGSEILQVLKEYGQN